MMLWFFWIVVELVEYSDFRVVVRVTLMGLFVLLCICAFLWFVDWLCGLIA